MVMRALCYTFISVVVVFLLSFVRVEVVSIAPVRVEVVSITPIRNGDDVNEQIYNKGKVVSNTAQASLETASEVGVDANFPNEVILEHFTESRQDYRKSVVNLYSVMHCVRRQCPSNYTFLARSYSF